MVISIYLFILDLSNASNASMFCWEKSTEMHFAIEFLCLRYMSYYVLFAVFVAFFLLLVCMHMQTDICGHCVVTMFFSSVFHHEHCVKLNTVQLYKILQKALYNTILFYHYHWDAFIMCIYSYFELVVFLISSFHFNCRCSFSNVG